MSQQCVPGCRHPPPPEKIKDTQIHSCYSNTQLGLEETNTLLKDIQEDIRALRQMVEARQEVEAVLVKLTDPLLALFRDLEPITKWFWPRPYFSFFVWHLGLSGPGSTLRYMPSYGYVDIRGK